MIFDQKKPITVAKFSDKQRSLDLLMDNDDTLPLIPTQHSTLTSKERTQLLPISRQRFLPTYHICFTFFLQVLFSLIVCTITKLSLLSGPQDVESQHVSFTLFFCIYYPLLFQLIRNSTVLPR